MTDNVTDNCPHYWDSYTGVISDGNGIFPTKEHKAFKWCNVCGTLRVPKDETGKRWGTHYPSLYKHIKKEGTIKFKVKEKKK